ncbi:MAG TPA: hypothetical protein VLQ91_03565, partial [Draconibacterium sp.]|nr:hypothetical protein [Draconibacterium sp.]
AIFFAIGEQKVKAEIQPTGDKFENIPLGEIHIAETGNQVISVTCEKENWNEIELMKIELLK